MNNTKARLITNIVCIAIIFSILSFGHVRADNNKSGYSRLINRSDVDILARVIFLEGGSDYYDIEMLYYVGSVVLNRVKHDLYPNTILEVVKQPGQYESTEGNYWLSITPPERCYDVATDLILNGSVLPENVVYQAQFKQGDGIFAEMYDTYFCYIDC